MGTAPGIRGRVHGSRKAILLSYKCVRTELHRQEKCGTVSFVTSKSQTALIARGLNSATASEKVWQRDTDMAGQAL